MFPWPPRRYDGGMCSRKCGCNFKFGYGSRIRSVLNAPVIPGSLAILLVISSGRKA